MMPAAPRLAEEERSLDKLRMAVAAEAAMLKEIEQHLEYPSSAGPPPRWWRSWTGRADSAPSRRATATLIEFAQLLPAHGHVGDARPGSASRWTTPLRWPGCGL